MLDEYLNKRVTVKLVTGETLPEGVRFYGVSSINPDMLWFVIPRQSNPIENEREFHVPVSSITMMELSK
ncbi:hypothetical protein KKB99_03555 [bacterium]|nr:hypothetical protein [bacterium]MBU1025067.1 hypothetical protein [bacterium]